MTWFANYIFAEPKLICPLHEKFWLEQLSCRMLTYEAEKKHNNR